MKSQNYNYALAVRGELYPEVEGLEAGADDYPTRPYNQRDSL